jgi:predicted HTH transcriptional regulator
MEAEQIAIVTDDQLLQRVSDTEHQFLERKTINDTDGWLKTAVAFANSCPVGQPGILYINVDDKGEIVADTKNTNFESFQKTVSNVINKAWPSIYFTPRILEKDGKKFLAVVVFGSPLRPHFAGRAWIRVGPETRDATEQQYDDLIAQRSSKYRRLKRLEGKLISWVQLGYSAGNADGILTEVTPDCLIIDGTPRNKYRRWIPVEWVTISAEGDRPKLIAASPL